MRCFLAWHNEQLGLAREIKPAVGSPSYNQAAIEERSGGMAEAPIVEL
jgi:hypothetical protein